MESLNRLGWAVHKSYAVGGHLFGIRTNSEICGAWLESTLGAYEVREQEADPCYSLWVPEEQRRNVRQHYVLYRHSDDLLRTLDPASLARGLLAEIETFALRSRDDRLFVDAGVIERNGRTALVPSDIVPYLRLAGKRVERELRLPATPTIAVRRDGGLEEVETALAVPDGACEDLAGRLGVESETTDERLGVPENVDHVLSFFYDPDSPASMTLSRALAVHSYAERSLNLRALGPDGLNALAHVALGKPCHALQSATAPSTLELVLAVLDGDDVPARAVAV
jgi:hypothetical protein